jgi:MFS family permease
MQSMRTFAAIWLSQLLSLTGSAMTAFGLGVFVYRSTGSSAQYAIVVLMLYIPQILMTFLGGALADRYSRRVLMLVANIVATLVSAGLVGVIAAGHLTVTLVYLVTLLFGACSAVQYPALASTVPHLVPDRHLSRANGMVQMAGASSRLFAPIFAAALLAVTSLTVVVLIDLGTFIYAVATLAVVTIPQPTAPRGNATGTRAVLANLSLGFRFIWSSPALVRLLAFFAVANIAAGFTMALLTPLVLRTGSTTNLGEVMSTEGFGVLAGSILMIAWGGPKRRIHGILGAGLLFGVGIAVIGLRPWIPLIAVGVLIYAVSLPIVNTCNSTLWQRKVPAELLGRVMGTLRMVALSTIPASALVAGAISDGIFEPLLRQRGALAGSVGRILGTGPGRGIGLVFVLVGLVPVIAAAAAYRSAQIRGLESAPPEAGVPASASPPAMREDR